MSHFVGYVVVPSGTADLEAAVGKAVAKYDEALEVPEYQQGCWCVGNVARGAGDAAADAEVGTIDSLRASFARQNGADHPDANALWKAHIAPWVAASARAAQAHPLNGKPDPECEECRGTGTHPSTYNPDSKWDWFAIGGRWAGMLPRDRATVASLRESNDPNKVPFAFVDSRGAWHQRGEMGWWGCVSDEKARDEWAAEYRALLAAEQPRAIVVAVDFHI